MNETQFLNGLRQLDPMAVRHLSECYLPSVWRYVYVRVSGDQHLAEDIVSETVLALIRATAVEAAIENPGAWLRSVAARKINDHFRAVARVRHLIDQVARMTPESDAATPVEQQEREEQRAAVRAAMDELGDPHRQVLEWKYIDKVSVRDIAVRLDTTEKAAESLLFRARREFRERLERRSAAPILKQTNQAGPLVPTGTMSVTTEITSEKSKSKSRDTESVIPKEVYDRHNGDGGSQATVVDQPDRNNPNAGPETVMELDAEADGAASPLIHRTTSR
ncbi:MAG: sigma-70 family RNA polymerase sigma factor [Planctomycetaceae bacterium]|nr:sigma-70 family RNA polymerase sigma factor [Planctomycetaceae bacterium]